MIRRSALAISFLALMLGVSACAGKTIVLDSPATSGPGHGSQQEDTSTTPSEYPRPDESPSPGEGPTAEEHNREQSGWWPPAPSPTPTASPSETGAEAEQDPSESPSETKPPDEGPSEGPDDGKNPGPGRFTFPGWEEYIYDSRNGDGPPMFKNRDRFTKSCGDFASEAGADLISPEAAECLDKGRAGEGKESAIAVRMSQDEVHVWFVRVGPEHSEYFVDRSAAGGQWMHASCDPNESIGMLDCAKPTRVEAEANDDEPEPSPSQNPDESPSPSPTPEETGTPAEDEPEKMDS